MASWIIEAAMLQFLLPVETMSRQPVILLLRRLLNLIVSFFPDSRWGYVGMSRRAVCCSQSLSKCDNRAKESLRPGLRTSCVYTSVGGGRVCGVCVGATLKIWKELFTWCVIVTLWLCQAAHTHQLPAWNCVWTQKSVEKLMSENENTKVLIVLWLV